MYTGPNASSEASAKPYNWYVATLSGVIPLDVLKQCLVTKAFNNDFKFANRDCHSFTTDSKTFLFQPHSFIDNRSKINLALTKKH